jgi:hypothetical protein
MYERSLPTASIALGSYLIAVIAISVFLNPGLTSLGYIYQVYQVYVDDVHKFVTKFIGVS